METSDHNNPGGNIGSESNCSPFAHSTLYILRDDQSKDKRTTRNSNFTNSDTTANKYIIRNQDFQQKRRATTTESRKLTASPELLHLNKSERSKLPFPALPSTLRISDPQLKPASLELSFKDDCSCV